MENNSSTYGYLTGSQHALNVSQFGYKASEDELSPFFSKIIFH